MNPHYTSSRLIALPPRRPFHADVGRKPSQSTEQVSAETLEFRRLVQTAGWTQEQAGSELGLGRESINRIWNGRQAVTKTLFLLLVERTKEIGRFGPETVVPAAMREPGEPRRLDPWEEIAVNTLRAVSPKRRHQLLEMAAVMADAEKIQARQHITVEAVPGIPAQEISSPPDLPGTQAGVEAARDLLAAAARRATQESRQRSAGGGSARSNAPASSPVS